MNTTGREFVGACAPEFLFASSKYPVSKALKQVASGQGVLSRGTALALNADGKCVILGTASATAAYILAEDIDATSADAVAEVYVAGVFNKNALILDGELSATDISALRNGGIFLENSVQ